MKKLTSLVIAAVMMMSLGCSVFAATAKSPSVQTYTNKKFLIEFKIDKSWKKLTVEEDGAMLASYQSTNGTGSSMNLQYEAPTENLTIEEYMKLGIDGLKSQATISNDSLTYVKGTNKNIKVAVFKCEMTINGILVKLYQYDFKYNNKFYIFTFGAPEATYAKEVKIMDAMIKTIKLSDIPKAKK